MGRDAELTRIEAALDRLESSRSASLDIVGEPGIGKTRLLDLLYERAEQRGFLALRGRAAQFERDAAFGAFIDALDDYLGGLNPRLFEPLGGEPMAELGRIFPSLPQAVPELAMGLDTERYRAHHAIRSLLALLAARKPLVLLIDDLHWLDDASQELLSLLLRRPPREPVLVALAYRRGQAPARLVDLMEHALREGSCERLGLGPLDPAQARELIGSEASEELIAAIHREAGGNPFYVEQLSRTDPARVIASGRGLRRHGEVPRSVLAALAQEVSELDPDARTLLWSAAVAGDPFDLDLAGAVAELDDAATLPALDALLASELIRETEVPREFRFRHPIVRRAVYDGADAGFRLKAHARAAAVLAARGAAASRRAHHVEHSAGPGDQDACELLAQAGHEAASRAPAAAAHWFEAALRQLSDDASSEQRLALMVPLATSLGAAGRVAESRDVLQRVLDEIPPELSMVRMQVIPFIALIEHLLGNHDAVPTLLSEAMDELDDPASPEGVSLRIEAATDRFYVNDNEALDERAAEAYKAARKLGDPALLGVAAGLRALASYKVARLEEAERLYAEASGLIDELPDTALAPHLIALFWLGWYGQCAERFDEGVRHLERGLAISRATGQGHLLVPMMVSTSILHTWRGRLPSAAQLADDAIDAARLALNDQSLCWALTLRCWIATLSGDLRLALACGTEAVETAERFSDNYFSKLASCYLADALLEAGEPQACRDRVLEAVGGPELEPLERPFRPHFYDVLTRSELALGRTDAAAEWTVRAEEAIEGVPLPGRIAEARRARAAVHLAQGSADRAAEVALEAVGLWEQRGNRLEAARTRTLAGRALGEAADVERAVAELERAREELAACGSARFADEAAHELRKLGVKVARVGRRGVDEEGPDALSSREREIAELVADGHTNKEIAATLYISDKTVEKHLSRVFEKLGVKGRAAVGSALIQK